MQFSFFLNYNDEITPPSSSFTFEKNNHFKPLKKKREERGGGRKLRKREWGEWACGMEEGRECLTSHIGSVFIDFCCLVSKQLES